MPVAIETVLESNIKIIATIEIVQLMPVQSLFTNTFPKLTDSGTNIKNKPNEMPAKVVF